MEVATKKETIQKKALEIIRTNSEGIRYSELVKEIQGSLPGILVNTIHGTV
jgi:transcription elongation factor